MQWRINFGTFVEGGGNSVTLSGCAATPTASATIAASRQKWRKGPAKNSLCVTPSKRPAPPLSDSKPSGPPRQMSEGNNHAIHV